MDPNLQAKSLKDKLILRNCIWLAVLLILLLLKKSIFSVLKEKQLYGSIIIIVRIAATHSADDDL